MKLAPVRELLADLPFKAIAGVDELAQVAERPNLALPAAYVLADAETGVAPIEGSYVLHQQVTATVTVLIVTRPDGARRGAAAEQLDALSEAVTERLFGRQPEGWDSPLVLADVRTVEVSPSLLARAVRMRGRTHLRTTLMPA